MSSDMGGAASSPDDPDRTGTDQRQILASSAVMAAGTMVSRFSGFLRATLLVAALGVGVHADIFNIANTVPNMLYILVAGGVFNAVLVPQLVRTRARGGVKTMGLAGVAGFDGAAVEQWLPEDLGQHIGYLPQDIELLEGTVAENISRFDSNATSESIIKAASAAGVSGSGVTNLAAVNMSEARMSAGSAPATGPRTESRSP